MKDFLCDDFWCKAIKYENEHKFSTLPEDTIATLMTMLLRVVYDRQNDRFLYLASKTDHDFLSEENWKIKLEHFEILKQQGYIKYKETQSGALIDFTPFWNILNEKSDTQQLAGFPLAVR